MSNSASVAIIDYGSGNLRSVAKAFEQVTNNVIVTSDAKTLATASHIVLPGVGAFADCMQGLNACDGMLDALREQVLVQKKQFLGVCVGMQMLFERGHEHGEHAGLGWLSGEVIKFKGDFKIPHMGWNDLEINTLHPLLRGIDDGDHAYFVHSYYAKMGKSSQLLASTLYGGVVPAVVGHENILGTQFHPEKSQKTGLTILRNFVGL